MKSIPRELLPYLLNRMFPVIAAPDELEQVPALVTARETEFCASLRTDAEMVALVCRAGYLPMSEDFTGHQVLLIKCHKQRAVHSLDELHISKSTRRRSRDLSLRLDHDFCGCLTAVTETHPDRWLTDALCASLAELHLRPRHGVRARSVEIYKDDVLVAGEIGYSCGGVYTSMAGFYRLSGAGKVQLLCLGVLLRRAGYAFWDLGMPMEYKAALGARTVDRTAFLSMYRGAWTQRPGELPGSVWSCHSLLQR